MYRKISCRVLEFNINKTEEEDFFCAWKIYSNQMALMYIIVKGFFLKDEESRLCCA